MKLKWAEAERLNNGTSAAKLPCFEATVSGGKYRAAPVQYQGSGNRYVGYEAFFIPTGAISWADTRDIAENLTSMEEAKAAAQADFDAS